MNCETALDRLLEADRVELEGQGDSPLALHVRDCEACRHAADQILASQLLLHEALATFQPSANAAPARARAWPWPLVWRGVIPLAAAASLAVFLLTRDGAEEAPEAVRPLVPQPIIASVAVSPPASQSIGVFETSNPKITVVWFFDSGR